MNERRHLVHLVGINGAGKTTVAGLLAKQMPGPVLLDAEKRAFDRRFLRTTEAERADPGLHAAIVAHCREVVAYWREHPARSIVVDRWYETYVTDSGLPDRHVREIEDAIVAAGFAVLLVNLVVAEDLAVLEARLAHTKAHRPAEWWDPSRGSIAERAASDLAAQRRNRQFCRASRFSHIEIDTTGRERSQEWSPVVDACAVAKEGSDVRAITGNYDVATDRGCARAWEDRVKLLGETHANRFPKPCLFMHCVALRPDECHVVQQRARGNRLRVASTPRYRLVLRQDRRAPPPLRGEVL